MGAVYRPQWRVSVAEARRRWAAQDLPEDNLRLFRGKGGDAHIPDTSYHADIFGRYWDVVMSAETMVEGRFPHPVRFIWVLHSASRKRGRSWVSLDRCWFNQADNTVTCEMGFFPFRRFDLWAPGKDQAYRPHVDLQKQMDGIPFVESGTGQTLRIRFMSPDTDPRW